MDMKRLALCALGALLIIVPAAAAPAARAGTYSVQFCTSGGTVFDNKSWIVAADPGFTIDSVCPLRNQNISIEVPVSATARVADNSHSGLVFQAPAGTTIADFRFDRVFEYSNPVASGTHAFYEAYQIGTTTFAGIGTYDDATAARLSASGDWYSATQGRRTVTKANFRSLAGYQNDANRLALLVGCYPKGSPCSLTGGVINNALFGASVELMDNVAPALSVEAFGLLAGGQPTGREPVRFSASDNAGVRIAELLDVTDPANPMVVASEDYSNVLNDRAAGCSFRLTRPCPTLSGETVASSTGVTGGRRQVAVRVTDVAGNQTTSPPTTVNVVPPFDRGALNGANATETGKVEVRFVRGKKRTRTVNYRARTSVRGRVLNANGQPVGNAIVHLLRKDERDGSTWRTARNLKTDSKGRFDTKLRATASRAWQFGWPSHVNDPQPAAAGHLRLRARASGTLSVRPRHIRRGNAVHFSGRLRGTTFPHGGVPVELQAFQQGRWRAVRTKRTNSKGRFTHRFCCWGGDHGTVRFRARILTDSQFPYERGLSNTVRRRTN
jgi:5-hydroxyisourate hydrolase-like protein (transthyretin family)